MNERKEGEEEGNREEESEMTDVNLEAESQVHKNAMYRRKWIDFKVLPFLSLFYLLSVSFFVYSFNRGHNWN